MGEVTVEGAAAGSTAEGEAPPAPASPATPAVPDMSPAACGARLAELFPALFAAAAPGAMQPAPGAQAPLVKPIKLKIHADIQARAPGVFTKRMLGIFFSRYTTSNAYLKALAMAPSRFDLDGEPAGDIAEEHRKAAGEELERRRLIAIEKRAAMRPPRRMQPPREGAGMHAHGSSSSDAPAPGREAQADKEGVLPGDRPHSSGSAQQHEPQHPLAPQGQVNQGPRGDRPPRRNDQAPRGAPRQPPRADHRGSERPRPEGQARRQTDQGGQPHPPWKANSAHRDARPQPRNINADPARRDWPPHPRDNQRDNQHQHPQHHRNNQPDAPSLPIDPAQRERALLLRAYEGSTLTKPNFCALKRMSEADLDAQLALAKQERTGLKGG
jgi:ProP effector